MLNRTKMWILRKIKANGEFLLSGRSLSWYAGSEVLTSAYILWCVSESGVRSVNVKLALERIVNKAEKISDTYILALIANTCFNIGERESGILISKRLATMQNKLTGEFNKPKRGICYEWGIYLQNSTCALCILALDNDPEFDLNVSMGYRFLLRNKDRYGCWGYGQTTMLVLKSIVQYQSKRPVIEGKAILHVKYNEELLQEFEEGEDLESMQVKYYPEPEEFIPGSNNEIKVEVIDGEGEQRERQIYFPVSVNIKYYSTEPVSTILPTLQFTLHNFLPIYTQSDIAKFTINLRNISIANTGMVVLILWLPAAFEIIHEHLEKLLQSKTLCFYEVAHANCIYIYWRMLKGEQSIHFNLFFNAKFTGTFLAKASCAYEYYNKLNNIVWLKGQRVLVKGKNE